MDRLGLHQLLMEPEILRTVQADVHLVGTLLSLSRVMPQKVKHTAREVVLKVVRELEQKLTNPLRQAVQGALSRAVRNLYYSPKTGQFRRGLLSKLTAG
jgi:hypothetical protein